MDSADWDARYDQHELVWTADPNRFVVDQVRGMAAGRALDVACGEGRNAVWLAGLGWDVVGVDFSPVAIDKARALAAHQGVTVDFRVGDVTDPAGLGAGYDLVLVAYLHLPPAQMAPLLAALAGRLQPGGTLLAIGHHAANLERGYGGPQDPAILHDPATLTGWLGGLVVDLADEVPRPVSTPEGERVAVDSLVRARRPA